MGYDKNKPDKNGGILTRIISSNAVAIFLNDDYDESLKREVYIFNETGTRIWELINGKHSLKDIAKKVCAEYDTAPRGVEKDIKEFVDRLAERRLIVNLPAGRGTAR